MTELILELLKQAEHLSKKGLYENAIGICNKIIQDYPDSYEGYEMRGSIFRHLNQLDKAIKDASEVIKLRPNRSSPYFRRGCLNMLAGNNVAAIKDFSQVIVLDDGYFEDAAFFYRAEAYLRCNQHQNALKDCAMIKGEYFEKYFYGHHHRSKQDIELDALKAMNHKG